MFRLAFSAATRRPSWAQAGTAWRHPNVNGRTHAHSAAGRAVNGGWAHSMGGRRQARVSSAAAAVVYEDRPIKVRMSGVSSSEAADSIAPDFNEWGRSSPSKRPSKSHHTHHPLYVSTPDASYLPRHGPEADVEEAIGKLASPPYSVLFFGMDSMSMPTLEALVNDLRRAGPTSCVRHLEVVRPHSLRKGFEVPKDLLDGVRVHTVPKGSLKGWKAPLTPEGKPFDLGVVVSFGYFLPSRVIDSFPLGVINMHPSMLPKYRGASPVATALMNGDSSSGVSIVSIRPREVMDSGSILASRAALLGPTWTYAEAEACLGNLGAQAMLHAIKEYPRLSQVAAPQPESEATLTAKIDANTRGLRFTLQTSTQVYNLWRSLTEFGFPYAMFRDCDGKEHRMVFRSVELASAVFDALQPSRVKDQKASKTPNKTTSTQKSNDAMERRAEAQTRIVQELNLLAPVAPPGSIYFAHHNGTHNAAFIRCACNFEASGYRRSPKEHHKGLTEIDKSWIAVRELSVQGRGVLPPERWRQWAKMEAGVLYSPDGDKGNYFVDAPLEKNEN